MARCVGACCSRTHHLRTGHACLPRPRRFRQSGGSKRQHRTVHAGQELGHSDFSRQRGWRSLAQNLWTERLFFQSKFFVRKAGTERQLMFSAGLPKKQYLVVFSLRDTYGINHGVNDCSVLTDQADRNADMLPSSNALNKATLLVEVVW